MNITNEVRLVGRIVDDEIKVQTLANSNISIAYLKIANSKRYYDQQANEWKEQTQFIPLKVFGKQAESIAKRFAKGDLVMVSCELSVSSSKNKEGQWNTYWSLIINNIIKLGKSQKKQDLSKTQETEIKNLNNNVQQEQDLAEYLFGAEKSKEDDSQPWELDI